ncbi:MAG: N-acetylmuramoyl-L-alanine amidase [bacterium]|nr:N-acetylmuramoyl-L-alanine amidase [bacterium]
MKRLLLVSTSLMWVGWSLGCSTAKHGVLGDLPDPVFATRAAVAPVVVPAIEPRRERPRNAWRVPRGWMPPSGVSSRWTCIVVHHSASSSGGAEAFDRHHRNVRKWSELGYHFVIGNGTDTADGEIEVGSRWNKQKHGAHCKTANNHYNNHGVGICLVGNLNHHPPTRSQMDSLARLVNFLMRECGIGLNGLHTHGGVTRRTECPGARFSLAALKSRLRTEVTAVSHPR